MAAQNRTAVRRIGSICTGAFLLAAAGLLDGKRATTHWKWAAELAQKCTTATIDPDPIFIRDGNTYTTAGVTAGMDLALALVEQDLGLPLALSVARELVLHMRRAGGQSQFSTALSLQASDRKQIEEIRSWVLDLLDESLPVEILAARARMSPRNFARVLSKDTGTTPARGFAAKSHDASATIDTGELSSEVRSREITPDLCTAFEPLGNS
ncbi:MAG: DJ-1/PfpI family protein [Terriglobales bacterium]